MHPLTWVGIALILLGFAFLLVPVLGKFIDFSGVPGWLIYVYHRDGFYFVTSPLLILLSMLSLIFHLLR